MRFTFSLLASIVLACHAEAATKLVLQGKPLFKAVATPDTVTWQVLPELEDQGLRCIIAKSDASGSYTWVSRNDTELFPLVAGMFTNFVGVAGVVRVGDIATIRQSFAEVVAPRLTDLSPAEAEALMWQQHFLLNAPQLREAPFAYVEILWKGLGVIMYFGVADELDL